MIYDHDFFTDRRRAEVHNDARLMVPEVRLAIGYTPRSVIDFGAGEGAFLQYWRALGATLLVAVEPNGPETWRVQGIDGGPVLGLGTQHVRANLSKPVRYANGRRFDLVQCLEVAEHLPQESAGVLVDSLCAAGDRILFSAAVPGQGGDGHINEQPLEYWMRLFKSRGYLCQDIVRERLSDEVSWWYRQNVVLFCKHDRGVQVPTFELLTPTIDGRETRELAHEAYTVMVAMSERGMQIPRHVVDHQACIDKARGELAARFLQDGDAEYSLWVDADMKPHPGEMLDLLVNAHMSGREALAAFAAKKGLPSELAHGRCLRGEPLMGPGAPQQPFERVGFGMIAVARSAFERIVRWSRQHPAHPWAVRTSVIGERLHGYDFFRPVLDDPNPRYVDLRTGDWARPYHSEDGSFCARLVAAGGELWALPQVWPGHEGELTFGAEHVRT